MDKILSYERKSEDDYYTSLGCSELSTEEQITTEYRARVLDCHPDKHPNDPKAAERFAKLSKAKETLTDPDSRSKYDKWRRSGIALSYDDWCGMRSSVHTSMHWASKAPQPQIAASSEHKSSSSKSQLDGSSSPYHRPQLIVHTFTSGDKEYAGWTSQTGSSLLQKFRNYEI